MDRISGFDKLIMVLMNKLLYRFNPSTAIKVLFNISLYDISLLTLKDFLKIHVLKYCLFILNAVKYDVTKVLLWSN